jgi:hypothetical protein
VEYVELRAFLVDSCGIFHFPFHHQPAIPRPQDASRNAFAATLAAVVTESSPYFETTKSPAVANYARLAIKEQISIVSVTLSHFPFPVNSFLSTSFTFFHQPFLRLIFAAEPRFARPRPPLRAFEEAAKLCTFASRASGLCRKM